MEEREEGLVTEGGRVTSESEKRRRKRRHKRTDKRTGEGGEDDNKSTD